MSGQIRDDAPTPKKETPKYEDSYTDSEDVLKNIKKEIISMCTELGGTKNADLMATLKEFVPSGNPNALKDVDKAKECLAKIKGIKPIEA